MLGKVYMALDFSCEQEKEQVQEIFKDLSNQRLFTGAQIVKVYPFVKTHQREIMQLFSMIKAKGPSAILSMQGAMLIKSLMK